MSQKSNRMKSYGSKSNNQDDGYGRKNDYGCGKGTLVPKVPNRYCTPPEALEGQSLYSLRKLDEDQ